MRDELLQYYERELAYLRQLGAEFASRYPKIASRLQLEPSRCEDPHVERLIEASAFLAARVHLKIDDEFPELSQTLLGLLLPHYTRPLPSMTVVEFSADPDQLQLGAPLVIPRDSVLLARPVQGYRCRFRTCAPVTLVPAQVSAARFLPAEQLDPPVKSHDTPLALRVELAGGSATDFGSAPIPPLRFFLNGEASTVFPLYEALANNVRRILVRTPGRGGVAVALPASCLRPCGFDDEEAVLPYPKRSFTGYRLLQEYFALPEKFLFLELSGLEPHAGRFKGNRLEIVFLFGPWERPDWEPQLMAGVGERTLRLGAAPAANLFEHTADPILVDQTRFEYPVVPDARRAEFLEVFSLEEVVATDARTNQALTVEPFYSARHGRENTAGLYWTATRRASRQALDENTDVWISLVDLDGGAAVPRFDTLTMRCLCTNREMPSRMTFGDSAGDFELDGAAPVTRIVALRKPTPTVRPATGRGTLWRLLSHMSLNYLSLVEEGKEALQGILRLYSTESGALERQVEGISRVGSRRHFARVISEHGISFVRGMRVELELDEDFFVGAGSFLFASVIDRFLGLYVSMNSFSQLELRTRQRKEVIRRWPPRAGDGILL